MIQLPHDARCAFIDGPVSVFVHESDYHRVMTAYDNIRKLLDIAARQLDPRGGIPGSDRSVRPNGSQADDRGGSPNGEGR